MNWWAANYQWLISSVVIPTAGILAALWLVRVGYKSLKDNRDQLEKSQGFTLQLALEERQHQSRPIIVPVGMINPDASDPKFGSPLYTSDNRVIWIYQGKIKLELQNMGEGVALNAHCVLYGGENIPDYQFVSWNNGPIGKNSLKDSVFEHQQKLCLSPDDSVDGIHPLWDKSLNSPSNPGLDRIACLTITYHDLFGIKHVSIFNYTVERQWVRVAIDKIPSLNEKSPLDLKELNEQKRQQAPKYSAPPILTSQGN